MYRVLTKSMFICVWLFIRFRTCTCGTIFAPGRRVITQFCRGLLWRKIMHPFSASQDHPFLVPGHAWCVPIIHVPPLLFSYVYIFSSFGHVKHSQARVLFKLTIPFFFFFLGASSGNSLTYLEGEAKTHLQDDVIFMPWNSSGQP